MSEKNGKHLSGTEPLFATYLQQKGAKMGLPISGTFELTPRCNFNCKMCYIHQNKLSGRELSADEWIGIGEEARNKGMLFLLLTGGEPFLRPDFFEIYDALRKMGLLISINTNGSLIDHEMLAYLKTHKPCRMNISLYGGCEETYERLCGVPMFKKVTENIRALKEAGISVKLNASITPDNKMDIVNIYDFAKELDVHVQATTYMYPPVRINGGKYGKAQARFNSKDAAKYMLLCREQYMTAEQLCHAAMDFCPDEDENDISVPDSRGMRCRARKTAFWITWDGRMLPCGMFTQPGYKVLETGFENAWMEVRKEAAHILLPSQCTNCPSRNRCGACAAACFAETGAFDILPEYICDMTKNLERYTWEKYGKGAYQE